MKKKVCIVTGTRAEYGILRPLIEKVKKDETLELQLFVTGMHLSPEFGMTYKFIEKDGYPITEKIEILMSSDTSIGISKSMGLTLISFAEAYDRHKPDMVVILGDRYETFAAMAAASVAKIPVAHIHGGEITEGAFDDAFRHSMTKMAYLHFTSTEEYRQRVIQLGEEPSRVFNVGAMGVENIKNLSFLAKDESMKKLKISNIDKYFMVVFHPVTLESNTAESQIEELLKALKQFKDYGFIFIKGNSDTQGRIINNKIEEFVKDTGNSYIFTSLSIEDYLGLLKYSEVLIGNSSSGIIEAPSLNVPTVNIGDRQKGRVRAESVIDCEPLIKNIEEAIKQVLNKNWNCQNPYGNGDSSEKILLEIKKFFEKEISLKKKFYNKE